MKLFNYKIYFFSLLMPLLFANCGDNTTFVNKKINNNLSPAETIKLYWDASLKGNVAIVNQLITKEPEDFRTECYSLNSETTEKDEKIEEKSQNFLEVISKAVQRQNDGVFLEYYDKDSEFFSIYSLSHIINIDRYSVRNLAIEKDSTFKDESRVNVTYTYLNSEGNLNLRFFLKKKSGGWKIFLILNDANLNLFDNEMYGKSKPLCSE